MDNTLEESINDISEELRRKQQPKKEAVIRDQKVRGAEHINHVGNFVAAKCIGPDCKCKRLRCFTTVSSENRENIFKHFYEMKSKDLQDSYLAGLICIEEIKQRRSRKKQTKKKKQNDDQEQDKGSHSASVFYKVRFQNQKGLLVDVPVCRAAFTSIHGITPARIRRIYNSLIITGHIPVDTRGKYKNRPKVFPDAIKDLIRYHILSFGPKPLSGNNGQRKYLSDTLSIRKMYKMFLNEYQIHISYRDYWNIFKTNFKIKFGVSRSKPRKERTRTSRNSRSTAVAATNDSIAETIPLEEALASLIQ